MRFVSFVVGGRNTWGILCGNEAVDVGAVLPQFPDLKSYLTVGEYRSIEEKLNSASRYSFDEIKWRPVIPNPDKILCVGLNYEMHRQETGRAVVAHPTIFGRYANTQIGHLENMIRPRISTELDFEGELAVVIGKRGRYISRADAMNHIAGFSCYNDGSIRDWQYHTHQFTPGKNFPGTGSLGPWMMTPDELGDLSELRITTRLNGETVQDARLNQMIFDIPTIIAYCSSFNQLEVGDVIATGTPGGVGAKRTPPLWMKSGDVVEVEIERLGTLRNSIADENQFA